MISATRPDDQLRKNTRLRVGISGSYGGVNLGDEAILTGMIGELRGSLSVELTVFSRDPEDTLDRHRVERSVAIKQLTRREAREEVQRLDVLILGGGGILYDADAEMSSARSCWLTSLISQLWCTPSAPVLFRIRRSVRRSRMRSTMSSLLPSETGRGIDYWKM